MVSTISGDPPDVGGGAQQCATPICSQQFPDRCAEHDATSDVAVKAVSSHLRAPFEQNARFRSALADAQRRAAGASMAERVSRWRQHVAASLINLAQAVSDARDGNPFVGIWLERAVLHDRLAWVWWESVA